MNRDIKAKDMNGAAAGNMEPNPEFNTVDKMASRAGIEIDPEKPISVYESLKERDQSRLEGPDF